jgi:WD40 repeat protein
MGLDTFAPTSSDDIFLNPEDTQAFLDGDIQPAGGVFSGGNDRSFRGKITDLAILSRSRRAVSASQDTKIKIWNLNSGTLLYELSGHTGWIEALAVREEESWMLSGGEDGIRFWDLKNQKKMYHDHSATISCLALSHGDQHAISGSRDGSISTWMIQPVETGIQIDQHA